MDVSIRWSSRAATMRKRSSPIFIDQATGHRVHSWSDADNPTRRAVLDADGKVGRAYGAKTTPHMFVIAGKGDVVYAGAIDDDNSVANLGKTNYVDAALAAVDAALHDAFTQFLDIRLVDWLGQVHTSLPTSITIGINSLDETLDEAMESITLLQTGKRYPLPLILIAGLLLFFRRRRS